MHADAELDVQGLHCPLPILKAKKALAALPSGQVLRVLTTDPGAPSDFAVFAKQTGHTLLQQQTEGAVTSHWLRKR
ncbi:MAG: sulfurtransferase TusA family protein [Brachymonas sp.]|nr:sulfurtransferase TusA family protein [Brachymonas sp.]